MGLVAVRPGQPSRSRAVAVLERNRRDGWTCPSADLYPHQWLWDSCFHAIVWAELGDERAVLVIDATPFPKSGSDSCGVARQWCGRLGKVENCQVGVYMAYVSRQEHALINARLYLPKEWAKDRARRKRQNRRRYAVFIKQGDCAFRRPASVGRAGKVGFVIRPITSERGVGPCPHQEFRVEMVVDVDCH